MVSTGGGLLIQVVSNTGLIVYLAQLMELVFDEVKNIVEQERQIVTRYACLTPSCNLPQNFIAIASIVLEIYIGQISSMKKKGNN